MHSMVSASVQKGSSAVPDRWNAESGVVARPGWSLLSWTELQVVIAVKAVMIYGRKQRKCVFVIRQDAVVRALGCAEVLPLACFNGSRAEGFGRRCGTVGQPPSRHDQPMSASTNTTSTHENVLQKLCLLNTATSSSQRGSINNQLMFKCSCKQLVFTISIVELTLAHTCN